MRVWICLICLIATPLTAQERAPFLGVWGTPIQCAGDPIRDGGTMRAAPFEITTEWLRNGDTWCALRWFPVKGARFASTRALCGEDSAMTYRLDMLRQGESLTLIWDEALTNGPLDRCPSS